MRLFRVFRVQRLRYRRRAGRRLPGAMQKTSPPAASAVHEITALRNAPCSMQKSADFRMPQEIRVQHPDLSNREIAQRSSLCDAGAYAVATIALTLHVVAAPRVRQP